MDFREQEMNNELEWMREQFQPINDKIKRPASLSAEALFERMDALDQEGMDMAEQSGGQVIRPKKAPWMRSAMGVAACFVVVFGAVFLQQRGGKGSGLDGMVAANQEDDSGAGNPGATGRAAGGAEPFALAMAQPDVVQAVDYTHVRDVVSQMNQAQVKYYEDMMTEEAAEDADMVMPEAAPMEDMAIMENPTSGGGGESHSKTNVQEAGVDEADIVKTDGTYLYSFVRSNTYNSSPTIFISNAKTMQVESKITLDGAGDIREFYLSGDQLVIVGYATYAPLLDVLPKTTIMEETSREFQAGPDSALEVSPEGPVWEYDANNTVVTSVVYDISNRKQPVKQSEFTQDGNYQSSRMVDGVLYLVSERNVYLNTKEQIQPLYDLIPFTVSGSAANMVPADKIMMVPQGYYPTYAVISAVDVKTGKNDTHAVLGGSVQGIYMSQKNCYVYYSAMPSEQLSQGEAYDSTGILRFSVDGLNISYNGNATVDGWIDGQFSFSEKDGNLRVATSASYMGAGTSSNVFVFDANMNEIGSLQGLAPGEQIYAVRYVGDMAYVVTFRQVDPLFAIDLSDPKSPKLLGQLKIPGFSEYLHPLDENTLLGIGQNADLNGSIQGLKLSLFDVSDPLNPKETGVYNFGMPGSYSEALNNHKAVMFHDGKQLFAFPATLTTKNYDAYSDVYMVFTYDKQDGFTLKQAIDGSGGDQFKNFSSISRGLYIGETLYTFSDDEIVSYDIDTLETQERVSLK